MELGNSWVVELAVLRENESGSDSWRRTDLGAEGSSLGYWESASFPGTYSSSFRDVIIVWYPVV